MESELAELCSETSKLETFVQKTFSPHGSSSLSLPKFHVLAYLVNTLENFERLSFTNDYASVSV